MDRIITWPVWGLFLPAAFLTGFYYLWPQRIFIHYLRENNNAHFEAYLVVGRWKFPYTPFTGNRPKSRVGLNIHRLRRLLNQYKPYFKGMTFKKFLMEIDLGVGDHALTGAAIGGGWALEGILMPLLYRYFRFETAPNIRINPHFQSTYFRLNWEGELAAPLSLWVKLWSLFKTSRRS